VSPKPERFLSGSSSARFYTAICLAFPVIDAMRDGYEAMS
jgi:hypothetical protein